MPSRPSANLTCVGFCFALKASKSRTRFDLTRVARAIPIPRPKTDPIVVWMGILLAANFKASRSSALRLNGVEVSLCANPIDVMTDGEDLSKNHCDCRWISRRG
jgi:hypothetical protein